MNQNQRTLGLSIFDVGAMKTKAQSPEGKGFKLKLHETEPNSPLSPFFMNLRTADNPKPGPLTPDIVEMIGQLLYELAKEFELRHDYVAGIPNAGDPFADAFAKAAAADGKKVIVVRMEKEVGKQSRKVTKLLTPVKQGTYVLLIDDLITRAGSKLEALEVLWFAGLYASGIVVLIDREQNGMQDVKKRANVSCFAVFKISELLDLFLAEGRINEETHREIFTYLFIK